MLHIYLDLVPSVNQTWFNMIQFLTDDYLAGKDDEVSLQVVHALEDLTENLDDKVWATMCEHSELPHIGSVYTQVVGENLANALNLLDLDLNADIDGESATADLVFENRQIDSVSILKDALKEAEELQNELDEA